MRSFSALSMPTPTLRPYAVRMGYPAPYIHTQKTSIGMSWVALVLSLEEEEEKEQVLSILLPSRKPRQKVEACMLHLHRTCTRGLPRNAQEFPIRLPCLLSAASCWSVLTWRRGVPWCCRRITSTWAANASKASKSCKTREQIPVLIEQTTLTCIVVMLDCMQDLQVYKKGCK